MSLVLIRGEGMAAACCLRLPDDARSACLSLQARTTEATGNYGGGRFFCAAYDRILKRNRTSGGATGV
jgi:hypothetical protein